MTHGPPTAILKVVAVTQRGETCRGRRSTEGTNRQGLRCAETTRHDVAAHPNPARPHAGSDDRPCRDGAGLRSGTDASVVATAPLHRAGGGLDPAFGTSPPVQAHTAHTARPVLLVHGFGGTKSSWSLLARTLRARGLTVEAITYTPFGTSVE